MAKSTKSQLPLPAPRPATPKSATQRIVQGGKTGAAPRVLPTVDAMTARQITEGRAQGRSLEPGHKLQTGERSTAAGRKEGA